MSPSTPHGTISTSQFAAGNINIANEKKDNMDEHSRASIVKGARAETAPCNELIPPASAPNSLAFTPSAPSRKPSTARQQTAVPYQQLFPSNDQTLSSDPMDLDGSKSPDSDCMIVAKPTISVIMDAYTTKYKDLIHEDVLDNVGLLSGTSALLLLKSKEVMNQRISILFHYLGKLILWHNGDNVHQVQKQEAYFQSFATKLDSWNAEVLATVHDEVGMMQVTERKWDCMVVALA